MLRGPCCTTVYNPIRSTDHRRHSAHINTVALHCGLPAVSSGLQCVPLRLHKNSYQNRSFLSQIKRQPVAREHFTGSYITPLAAAQRNYTSGNASLSANKKTGGSGVCRACPLHPAFPADTCVRVLGEEKKRGGGHGTDRGRRTDTNPAVMCMFSYRCTYVSRAVTDDYCYYRIICGYFS